MKLPKAVASPQKALTIIRHRQVVKVVSTEIEVLPKTKVWLVVF